MSLQDEVIKAALKDARRARFIDWAIYAALLGLAMWLIAIYVELAAIRVLLERNAQ